MIIEIEPAFLVLGHIFCNFALQELFYFGEFIHHLLKTLPIDMDCFYVMQSGAGGMMLLVRE